MSHDILAGLLPAGNPLAPFDAARRTADATAAEIAPDAPAIDSPASNGNASEAMPEETGATSGIFLPGTHDRSSSPGEFPVPRVQPPPTARRHHPSFAGPLLATFALLLFAAIGACLYLLVSGMAISPKGRLVAVDAKPPESADPPPTTTPDAPKPIDSTDDDRIPATRKPEPTAEPERAAEPDTGSADQGEPQWDHVYQTLRSGKFSEMTSVTGEAVEAARTPEQRAEADRLHRLAGLAEYYDEGIRRGATGLGAAEVFELVPGITVVVVESSRDEITLKVEGRVKTFSSDSMPLVLAHRLAKFSLSADDPVAEAARGAYQALWPQATDAHRRQSFQWWRDLEGSTDEIGVWDLEETVRELFEMPTG